jgi:hypothetical protein
MYISDDCEQRSRGRGESAVQLSFPAEVSYESPPVRYSGDVSARDGRRTLAPAPAFYCRTYAETLSVPSTSGRGLG